METCNSDNRLNAIVILAKNPILGKAKTRLAKTIGNRLALKIYTYLLNYTTKEVQKIDCKKTVLLAYHTNEEELFPEKNFYRALQINGNLGDKIKHAFQVGFQHKHVLFYRLNYR